MNSIRKPKWIALILAVMLTFTMIPQTVSAASDSDWKVHVIIENTTFTPETAGDYDAAWSDDFWQGTLVDTWVELQADSTMMSCIQDALAQKGYEAEGLDTGYIYNINGLYEFDGGSGSGWMGTLNDWFTNQGFDKFSVSEGQVEDGDEIRIMYTCDYGIDLGGSKAVTDTSLKALAFSEGTLDKEFDGAVTDYTLTVYSDTASVTVTPTALNKNFQVRTYIGDEEYKRTAEVPVENGTVITVKCGDPSWPSMSDSEAATEYTIKVVQGDESTLEAMVKTLQETLKAVNEKLEQLEAKLKSTQSQLETANTQLGKAETVLSVASASVSGLNIKTSAAAISGSWTAVKGAEKYNVVLLQNNKNYKTAAVSKASVSWSSLPAGYQYTMQVTPCVSYKETDYTGKTVSKTVTVNLNKASGVSVKKKNASYYIIKAADRNSTGYEISLARNSKFTKGQQTVSVKTSGSALSKKLKTSTYFKKGTTYVKVRAYNTYNGITVYGAWSSAVKVKR